jgi:hypothetical protein
MQLEGFELIELAFDSGIQVSKVREQATGHIFQVHVFHGEMLPEFDRICRLLPEVPPRLNVAVEAARSANSGYVRTVPLPDGVGILQWAATVLPATSDTESTRLYRLALQLKQQRQSVRPDQ